MNGVQPNSATPQTIFCLEDTPKLRQTVKSIVLIAASALAYFVAGWSACAIVAGIGSAIWLVQGALSFFGEAIKAGAPPALVGDRKDLQNRR
jgi:hypothetical protein